MWILALMYIIGLAGILKMIEEDTR